MWSLRRVTTGGMLLLAMLAGVAAVAPGSVSAETAVSAAYLPLTIAQPIVSELTLPGVSIAAGSRDALVLAAVGLVLMMTGTVVRRVT
jgi:hypothetical protein